MPKASPDYAGLTRAAHSIAERERATTRKRNEEFEQRHIDRMARVFDVTFAVEYRAPSRLQWRENGETAEQVVFRIASQLGIDQLAIDRVHTRFQPSSAVVVGTLRLSAEDVMPRPDVPSPGYIARHLTELIQACNLYAYERVDPPVVTITSLKYTIATS